MKLSVPVLVDTSTRPHVPSEDAVSSSFAEFNFNKLLNKMLHESITQEKSRVVLHLCEINRPIRAEYVNEAGFRLTSETCDREVKLGR